MSANEVELFRSDDYVPDHRVALMPLLREFFEPLVGQSLEGTQFQMYFLPVTDGPEPTGDPTMVNLRASHGWAQVRILREHRVLYQHPHAVQEIIAGPLREHVGRNYPEEKHWGYCVRAPGMEQVALVRPAPHATNQVDLNAGVRRRPRRFHVEEIPEREPPIATLAELDVDQDGPASAEPVGVVVDVATFDGLARTIPFSAEVEEGGFLVGNVYRAAERAGSYLVKVTGAVPAERTGASMMHFTFTAESFLRMGARLDSSGNGERLVGWYHTHLFPASDRLGLSSIDVQLHTSTFRQPAQVAGLVNVDGDRRVLRFYRSDGSEMAPAPYWVARR